MSKSELTDEQIKKGMEALKDISYVNNLFEYDYSKTYTEDEDELKRRIEAIREYFNTLDDSELYTSKETLTTHEHFLKILAYVINDPLNMLSNTDYLNELITDYDRTNTFINKEGDKAYDLIAEYGKAPSIDSDGFYIINDTILDKVLEDNDFYITDDKERTQIKHIISDTWENQKEILTQDKLNNYSEKRNGINFKHFIFCEEYIKRGKIKPTCDYLGISRNTAYLWLKDENVQRYLKDRQDEIKRETDDTFINTYRASFNELNKMINSEYMQNADKIKAIDTFLKHYENIERLKQPLTTYED